MFTSSKKTIISALSLLACNLAGTPAFAAPGDLLVSPVRVVFEGRTRVAEVTLVNKGDTKSNYRISFENRRMERDGQFEKIETPGEGDMFAEKLVRYAPRRVTLEPNAPQTLRLMLRKPSDLVDGEYRSHLHFAAVPDDAKENSIEDTASDSNTLSIRLTPIYGVTIPIIVRHGEVNAAAEIADLDFSKNSDGTASLAMILKRTGNMSLYGDLHIYVDGEEEPVASKRGIAVYVPNQDRELTFPLSAEVRQAISGKNVRIEYTDLTQSGTDISSVATAHLN